ncbi:alpha-amylase [Candidatus Saccharibacteria bacterium]|nr:MAG: alpha-amylase [Candidatus Saccharibacteria bacterium]
MKHIYEIHTAVWLQDLSRRYKQTITLATVPDDIINRLKTYHMDTVWLMGVWQRSQVAADISRQDTKLVSEVRQLLPDYSPGDIIGSAYAVKAYVVDERFGGNAGLAVFRQQLARHGIQLILDFVPNHTAFDHAWLREHPDFYITGESRLALNQPEHYYQVGTLAIAKAADPNLSPWPDVAQVNAFSRGYRQASIATLQHIATLCDGVRCDMAMLLLTDVVGRTWGDRAGQAPDQEYWSEVIQAVKITNPAFIFIAESYWDTERNLIQLGFNACYDKPIYDAMVNNDTESIARRNQQLVDISEKLVHFLENHDERRAASVFTNEQIQTYSQQLLAMPGLCLWYDGQFEGHRTQLPVHIGRGPKESTDTSIESIYSSLLS